jgi:hypothetical protein
VAQPSDDQRPATDAGELAMKIAVIGDAGRIGSRSLIECMPKRNF